MSEWSARPHRRYNPLTKTWVLVSPHRTDRPWLGERAASSVETLPAYDPSCYLCPGNARAGGQQNPSYTETFVFDNDFPALLRDVPAASYEDGPFRAESEGGACRVVCFSPRHDLHVASMPRDGVVRVIDCWANEYATLIARDDTSAVTIFENRGAAMGASNPHPHSQIWANQRVPNDLLDETEGQRAYRADRGICLLCDYVERELHDGSRVLFAGDEFVAVVPFWATWPFEALVVPRTHCGDLTELSATQRRELAEAMRDLVARYDRLFGVPFPYSMGFHQRPRGGDARDWHLHAHYYPPLLRSADVRKYMVGYEMLAQPQRDLTPESAAERLRAV